MTTEASLERTYTIDEFMDLDDDAGRYELVQGRLRPMSPTSEEHGRITGRLSGNLWVHVFQHALGEIYGAETAFVLDASTGDVRAADVAFVASSRLVVSQGAIPFPPDLAAEVISRSDRLTDVRSKAREYQRAGVRITWVVNPRDKTLWVYHPDDTEPTTLGLDDTLDGEDVVPGFTLPARALFEPR